MIQYDLFLLKRRKPADTHTGRIPCEYQGGIQGDSPTSQGMPKIARISPETREKFGTESSSQLSEGTNTADILISDFWSLKL